MAPEEAADAFRTYVIGDTLIRVAKVLRRWFERMQKSIDREYFEKQ